VTNFPERDTVLDATTTKHPISPNTEKKKGRSKLPLPLTLAMLGLVSAWCVGQAIPLFNFFPPDAQRIILAKEAVTQFREAQIESGIYTEIKDKIPAEIQDSVLQMILEAENDGVSPYKKQAMSVTTTVVDEFIDEEGNEHRILLLNAHAMPSAHQPTINLKTNGGLYTGNALCLPYDYVGENLYFVDQNQPIRDLALCDFKIIKKPGLGPVELPPLSLSWFNPILKYSEKTQYLAYGFPINIDETNTGLLTSPDTYLVSRFRYHHDDSQGKPYFAGDPYGPGGSGGVLISENQQIEGIMTNYTISSLASDIYNLTGYNTGGIMWATEEIPADLEAKIASFKETAINKTFQNVPLQELKYSDH
jgi:hypothetical protein